MSFVVAMHMISSCEFSMHNKQTGVHLHSNLVPLMSCSFRG